MLTTSFTELTGCKVPIQQAGMGGVGTAQLAAAVADAGALGMVALHGAPAGQVAAALDELAATTDGVVGMNFLMPFIDEAAVEAAATRCRVVEFFYADPAARLVERVQAGGALACWQVGSADEARAAADAGCDLIAAQGTEAGGHVRGELALLPLLDAVLDRVRIPVLAAGGIATARGVAAVLAAGAAGGLLAAAHDLSDGGLAVALAECCLAGRTGCAVTLRGDPFTCLFSESAARAVVAVRPGSEAAFAASCAEHGVPAAVIGATGGVSLEVAGLFGISLDELGAAHGQTLPAIFG